MACLVVNFVWNLYGWYGNTQRRSRPALEKNFDSSFSRAGRFRATLLVLRASNRNSKGIKRELQENQNPFAKTRSHRISHVLPKRLTAKAPGDTCESSATTAFSEVFVGFHLEHLMLRWEPAGPPRSTSGQTCTLNTLLSSPVVGRGGGYKRTTSQLVFDGFFSPKFLAKFSSQLCLFNPYICEMAQSNWDIQYVEWNSQGIVLNLHII